MQLEGKVALITGGGRGLGRATAMALADRGARVVALARSLAEVEETAITIRQQYGIGRSMAIRADVTSEREVVEAFDTVRRRWGGVDILVNNAGDNGATKRVISLTLSDWERTLAVNLSGTFLCSREALRDMSRGRWGRIINISSGSAVAAVPAMAPYSVAKAAVEHFTRILAAEAQPLGVTVLAFRPGILDTRMQEDLRGRDADAMPPELRAMFAAYKQRGMLVAPEQAAQVIAYLCASDSPDLSGRVLDLDEVGSLLAR